MFKPNRFFQKGLDKEKRDKEKRDKDAYKQRKFRDIRVRHKHEKVFSKGGHNSSSLSIDHLSRWITNASALNTQVMTIGITNIANILCSHSGDRMSKIIIDSGVIDRLITILKTYDTLTHRNLIFQCLRLLTNIGYKCSYKLFIVDCIEIFANIIENGTYDLKKQIIWALGNMAVSNEENNDFIVNSRLFLRLVMEIEKDYNEDEKASDMNSFRSFIYVSSRTISVLSVTNKNNKKKHASKFVMAIDYLIKKRNLLMFDINTMKQMEQNIAYTWYQLSIDQNVNDYMIISNFIMNKQGVLQKTLELLQSNCELTINTFINILNNDKYTEICIYNGILNSFYSLLKFYVTKDTKDKSDISTVAKICFALSNITAGSLAHNKYVKQSNLFVILIELLKSAPLCIASEAIYALKNASYHYEITLDLVQFGLISVAVMYGRKQFVFGSGENWKGIMIVLDLLQNILMYGNGYNNFIRMFEEAKGLQFLDELKCNDEMTEAIDEKISTMISMLNTNDFAISNINFVGSKNV